VYDSWPSSHQKKTREREFRRKVEKKGAMEEKRGLAPVAGRKKEKPDGISQATLAHREGSKRAAIGS